MPSSFAMQSFISYSSKPYTSATQKFLSRNCFRYTNSIGLKPKLSTFPSVKLCSSITCRFSTSPAAVTESFDEETSDVTESFDEERSERLRVVVKPIEKPRLVLKFIWMEKNIGLALDQFIPGHGTIPLSPYYFWPRKDAWDELKTMLERKPWISEKQVIILLNQATDIITLWQQNGGELL